MTAKEAMALKAGDRVIFRGCSTMTGKVVWNRRKLLEIAWDDDVITEVDHVHMTKIERLDEEDK